MSEDEYYDPNELTPEELMADPPVGRKKPKGKKVIPVGKVASGVHYDPRCKTCTHEFRRMIDKLIVTPNISYREIAKLYGISHNSVINHAAKHLDYTLQSIQNIIADEAAINQADISDGVRGETARNVFLKSYLQKTTEALLDGDLNLSGKEAMAAIEMLHKQEEQQFARQLQTLSMQFEAYMQAMKEIVTPDVWYLVVERTKEIIDQANDPDWMKQQQIGERSEVVVEGEWTTG